MLYVYCCSNLIWQSELKNESDSYRMILLTKSLQMKRWEKRESWLIIFLPLVFYKGILKFFFGRNGHWTVWIGESGFFLSINFQIQIYACINNWTRGNLPDFRNMVFTDFIVNITFCFEYKFVIKLTYRYIPQKENQVLVLWYMLRVFLNLHCEHNWENNVAKISFNYLTNIRQAS